MAFANANISDIIATTIESRTRKIADNVTIEIRKNYDIVKFRFLDQLHTHVVNDPVFEFDIRIALGHITADIKP